MSKATEYDFQNVCRTCLSTQNLNSLFDKRDQNSLDEMLMICTPIQYHVNDGLPVHICDKCISELNDSYKFALKCREADTELRIYIQKLIPEEYAIAHPNDLSLEVSEVEEQLEETSELGIKTELDDSLINGLRDEITVENIEIEPKTEHLLEVQSDISKIRLLLNSHQTPPQAYQCTICQTNFNTYSSLEQHQQLHTNDEIPCTNSKLPTHEKQLYLCHICNKTFKTPANLAIHKRSHATIYACPICGIITKRKSDLTRHTLTHTTHKPFACKRCNMVFKHRTSLRYHLLTHANKYICSHCDTTFPQQSELTEHLLSHTNQNEFTCNVCRQSFTTQGDLTTHLSTHTEKRPYSCTVCGNAYKQPQHLKYHMRKHTGEKPYLCKVCGKRFSQPYGLPRHMLTHTGEKPFPCTFCVKSFQQKTHLNTHIMRMHTTESTDDVNNSNKAHIDVKP